MLTHRIIPCLDVKDGRVVKGVNFVNLADAGDPVEQARLYDQQGADEITFLDISASHEGRKTILDIVERTADQVFTPLTVGGGISTLMDIRNLLLAGADKISINSAAIRNPDFVKEASQAVGAQCVVLAIDARKISSTARKISSTARKISSTDGDQNKPKWEIFTHGGRHATGIDALEWAEKMVAYGAGELLVTSMDRDGTRSGYDIELLALINQRVNVPVIASGGVGDLSHLRDGIIHGKADAVLAASIFHYGEYSIKQAKEYLIKAGLPLRLT